MYHTAQGGRGNRNYKTIISESFYPCNWEKPGLDRIWRDKMKLGRADRRTLAAAIAAGAAMVLCFALRSTAMGPFQQIAHERPAAAYAQGGERVDINTAGLEELMSLPGIGRARAQAILDDREENGPYLRPEDLIRVKGIGEGILEDILDQITTGGYADAQNTGG